MLEVRSYDGACVMHVRGDIDLNSCGFLGETIRSVARDTTNNVFVDFSDCRYVDSSCLNVLIRERKALGDRLWIVVPPATSLRRIFAISRLDDYLEILDRLEDGLQGRVA